MIDSIKAIYVVLKEANRLDLIEQMTSLREDLISLREENIKYKEELTLIKEQLENKSKIIFSKGICWIVDDDLTDEDRNTSICPRCWQVDRIVVRANPYSCGSDGMYIDCKSCNQVFSIS